MTTTFRSSTSVIRAQEVPVSLCSPTRGDVLRLRQMLHDYDRDVVWLRARHVYHLTGQPDQISFEVIDANGTVLRDRSGMIRRQTWQLLTPDPSMAPGDQVYVCRDGYRVQVRFLATISGQAAAHTPTQAEWATGA